MSAGRRRAALLGSLLFLILAGLLVRRQLSGPDLLVRSNRGMEPESSLSTAAQTSSEGPALSTPDGAGLSTGASLPRNRSLRFHDEAGQPIRAKVRVLLSWDQFKTFQIIDLEGDDHGNAQLSLDTSAWVLLDVRAPGHRGQLRSPVTWGDLPDEPVEFALEKAVPIEVRPVSNTGAALPDLKIRLSPEWPSGDFTGLAATKMGIVDDERLTDNLGRASVNSLRPGPYLLTFPDHPKWPALRISAEDLNRPTISVRLPWATSP